MKLIKVSFEQCRLDFFKEQFATAKRKLDWAVKHNPNCYDVAEKADAYNFYEWAVKMAEMAVKDTNVLTNADRIRAMSDEELAEDFCKTVLGVMNQLGVANTGSMEDAIRTRLEWLKQPAEVDNG